jgi:putative transposase
VISISRSVFRYRSTRDGQVALRMRINEIAAVRVRYGYKRIHVLLRREGWGINHIFESESQGKKSLLPQ